MSSEPHDGYTYEFIEFLVQSGVLTFGEFMTKSGRLTPYFLNFGNLCDGMHIKTLGAYYARAIQARLGWDFDVLYGPAYKGIPIVVTTAIAAEELFNEHKFFTFNRKETKDHGEQGGLVGHQLRDGERVLILEDVMTAGTSIHESIQILGNTSKTTIQGVMISVDRQERGRSTHSASNEIVKTYHFPVYSIVTITDIITYLYKRKVAGKVHIDDYLFEKIKDYRQTYGCIESRTESDLSKL